MKQQSVAVMEQQSICLAVTKQPSLTLSLMKQQSVAVMKQQFVRLALFVSLAVIKQQSGSVIFLY